MSPDLGKPPGLLLMKYAGRGEFIGDVRGCEPVTVPSKFPAPSEERISFPRLESLIRSELQPRKASRFLPST